VLSTDRLVTVRFMPLPSFDAIAKKFASSHDAPKSSLEVFTLLCEEIVDHVAGIAQNDVFKVLTIVSIVGIPPTLVAGIYGMNFKNMPEYDWAWGYQYGWMIIILSALIPLIWFKLKGWF
jgi:Mg2+ and Co2+ transporter CorA